MTAVLLALAISIVGHPVDVRCAAYGQWPDPIAASLGPRVRAYTWFGSDGKPRYTVYGPDTCYAAEALLADPLGRVEGFWLFRGYQPPFGYGTTEQGVAMLTFVHELEHERLATQDEGVVECEAVRALPGVLASLGALQAARLYAVALAAHRIKPPAYQAVC